MTSLKITRLDSTSVDVTTRAQSAPQIDGVATSGEAAEPGFNITLPKAVFELYRFCAKPQDRPVMACVELRQVGEQFDGQFVASATDGHRAITVTFKAAADDNYSAFPASVLLPAHLLKATKPKGKHTAGTVSAIGDAMRIQTGDLVGECDATSPDYFPNIAQVMPAFGAPDGQGCKLARFNLAYLADLGAMVKACGDAFAAPVMSWPADAESPLRADCQVGDATLVYVQMPVRL